MENTIAAVIKELGPASTESSTLEGILQELKLSSKTRLEQETMIAQALVCIISATPDDGPKWEVGSFVRVVRKKLGSVDMRNVFFQLDSAELVLWKEENYSRFCQFSREAFGEALEKFPSDLLWRQWNSLETQVKLLEWMLGGKNGLISLGKIPGRKLVDRKRRIVSGAINSLDLFEFGYRLYNNGERAKAAFIFNEARVREKGVFCLGLFHLDIPPGTALWKTLVVDFLEVVAGSPQPRSELAEEAFRVNKKMFIAMIEESRGSPEVFQKVVDTVFSNGQAEAVASEPTTPTVIEFVTALWGSKSTEMKHWVTKKVREEGGAFVEACKAHFLCGKNISRYTDDVLNVLLSAFHSQLERIKDSLMREDVFRLTESFRKRAPVLESIEDPAREASKYLVSVFQRKITVENFIAEIGAKRAVEEIKTEDLLFHFFKLLLQEIRAIETQSEEEIRLVADVSGQLFSSGFIPAAFEECFLSSLLKMLQYGRCPQIDLFVRTVFTQIGPSLRHRIPHFYSILVQEKAFCGLFETGPVEETHESLPARAYKIPAVGVFWEKALIPPQGHSREKILFLLNNVTEST
ncbi:MAG: CCR4-NOT transcription complex subunit 1, NOT1, partial [Amphiamblys sp. WSBS2006]